jgi:hypothetical protein
VGAVVTDKSTGRNIAVGVILWPDVIEAAMTVVALVDVVVC